MSRTTAAGALAALVLGAAAASCGGSQGPSASPTPAAPTQAATSPATSPPSTPSPTPTPVPDDERVVVTETGVGAYLETTYPVAILHSAASGHTARQVTVHLAVTAGARQLGAVDARIDAVPPGATVPVSTRLQARATAGEMTTATVTAGAWDAGSGPPPVATVGAATFSCTRCSAGAASGDVLATLTVTPGLPAGTPVQLVSVCRSATGAIVGGGSQTFVPPGGTAGAQADVPTVVSARPATCTMAVEPVAF